MRVSAPNSAGATLGEPRYGVRSQCYSKVLYAYSTVPTLPELFNRKPQGSRLGRTSRSAYIFLDNVVRMELRLFSRGLLVAYTTHNPTIFNRGLLKRLITSCRFCHHYSLRQHSVRVTKSSPWKLCRHCSLLCLTECAKHLPMTFSYS